jgi:hypothetical protein
LQYLDSLTNQLAETLEVMLCIFLSQCWQETLESQLNQLFVSQIQTIALVSNLFESLNESNNCFIVPLLESSQISNLHLMDAREEVIMEPSFQIGPLDDKVS